MKKSSTIIYLSCIFIFITSIFIVMLLFQEKQPITQDHSFATKQSFPAQETETPPQSSVQQTQNQPSEPALEIDEVKTKQPDLTMKKFVNKLENLLNGNSSRIKKGISLMEELEKAKNDDEKIAILQTLSLLKPIEQVDNLIEMAKSTKESDSVKAALVNTLNETYLLDEDEMELIGVANAIPQLEKISSYMADIVDNANSSEKLRNEALLNYAYTNEGKAEILVKNLIQEDKKLKKAEESLINTFIISNKDNLNSILPQIVENPKIMSDDMAMQMSVFCTDDLILEELTEINITSVIKILEAHKLDKDNPNYKMNEELLKFSITKLQSRKENM